MQFPNKQADMSMNNDFALQPILNSRLDQSDWFEMLYRPRETACDFEIERFFGDMNYDDKIDFDLFALSQAESVQKVYPGKRLSLNISPLSLCNKKFISKVILLSENKRIKLDKICFEIVETDCLSNLCTEYIDNISYLRKQGAWFALDDFGNGFSHWQLLKHGLVDVIKTVNNNVSKTQVTDVFLSGLSDFARSQGAISVLEGIETQKDLELGLSMGFGNFQGFLFD